MKYPLYVALGLFALLSQPTQAQRKTKVKAKGEAAVTAANRLQPLFGGISQTQAQALVGAAFLADVERSFTSKTEASRFFATKGYEYLTEGKADTAIYRFNLAWLLDPKNADAYRGLGVVASAQPTPDAAIGLLSTGLGLAPTSSLLLSDLGTSYLIRYGQNKKKKDLAAGFDLLQRATTLAPTNANAWQELARGFYYQEKYAEAWAAVHKGQAINPSSLDFNFVSDLLAKLPDPQGTFK